MWMRGPTVSLARKLRWRQELIVVEVGCAGVSYRAKGVSGGTFIYWEGTLPRGQMTQ